MFSGFFNDYNSRKTLVEIILKDINHIFLMTKNFVSNGFKSKSMLIYPDYPGSGSTIYKIAKRLRYNITNRISKHPDRIIYWEDQTFKTQYKALEKFNPHKRIMNLHCKDISKTYVDTVFGSVFNYSVSIDPLTYTGKIVKKSNINAAHDGEVLQGPLHTTDPNFVYQRLINNIVDTQTVLDIRVPIVEETLDFVYYKYRKLSERFKNTTINTKVIPIYEAFSQNEIDLINAFCKKLQLDFGELDILRDTSCKTIFIVDVNNTPHGPPANTKKEEATLAIDKIANAFEKYYLKKDESLL